MNSIKELKEQLGYEEIGLDDTFTFHCTQCGKCCIHREDREYPKVCVNLQTDVR